MLRILYNLGGKNIGPGKPAKGIDRIIKYVLGDIIDKFKTGLTEVELRKKLIEDSGKDLSLYKVYFKIERVINGIKRKKKLEKKKKDKIVNLRVFTFI